MKYLVNDHFIISLTLLLNEAVVEGTVKHSDEGMCAFPFKGVDFLINGSGGRVRRRGRVCRVELGPRGEVRGKETTGLGPEPGLTVPLHSLQTKSHPSLLSPLTPCLFPHSFVMSPISWMNRGTASLMYGLSN